MPESFLQNAQLTGLDRAARRTEILRAKREAALDDRVVSLEVPAVRYFTATSASYANGATTDIAFADNVGNGQGNPGFGNPNNGEVTTAVRGLYLFSVELAASTSYSTTDSGFSLKVNGVVVQSVPAHGPFARPSGVFVYPLLTDTATTFKIAFFNNSGAAKTATAKVVAHRLTAFSW